MSDSSLSSATSGDTHTGTVAQTPHPDSSAPDSSHHHHAPPLPPHPHNPSSNAPVTHAPAPPLPPHPHPAPQAQSHGRSSSNAAAAESSSSSSRPRVSSISRQLQSIRSSDLESEHSLWSHSSGLEEVFWLKQEERFVQLLKRAQVAAASMKDLREYLRKSSKLLAGLSESLQGLGSFGVTGETGTMRAACMSIDIVRKTTSSYLGELNTRVFGEALRAVGVATEDSTRMLSTIEAAGSDMLKTLKNQRRVTMEAWLQYYKSGQERSKCEAQGIKLKSDPYLLARQYESELYQLQTNEHKFQQLMTSLLKDLQVEESKRLTIMKTILNDNLSAQKAVLEHSVKFTENALSTVRSINPEADIQEFVQVSELYLPPANSSAESTTTATHIRTSSTSASATDSHPNLDGILSAHAQTSAAAEELRKETPVIAFLAPPPARDPFSLARVYAHEIEKEGELYRQGNIIKSNWKLMHAVITSSGYLHLFESDPKQRKTVHSSYALGDATVESGESVHPLAFGLKFINKGVFSSSPTLIYFRANNSDELMEWTHHATKHQQRSPGPSLTTVPHTEKEANAAAAIANAPSN